MTRMNYALIASLLTLSLGFSANPTEIPGTNGIPDLTKGGVLTRVNLRWAGPVGIFCGSWRPRRQKITDVRQIQVLAIEKGSPADGVLKIDDVILGADGTDTSRVPLFAGASYALMPLSSAITEAEARTPAILKLLIWRPEKKAAEDTVDPYRNLDLKSVQKVLKPYTKGKTITLDIKLESLGRYSDTAPYDCEKSKNILRRGVKALYESDRPGTACLGALCLLAADDPTNPDNDKYQARAKEWIYKMIAENPQDWGPWQSGPRLAVLAEYYMKTKDEAIFPELVKRAEHHANGVSWIGTSGHRWGDRQPDGSSGRISGYGAINCSGVLGFLGLSLARKAGVKSPIVELANKRQRIFFGHYAERGNIIYGEYYYGINGGTGDQNGRHAMPALALGLLDGQEKKAKYFTRMSALATSSQRTYAHGGPFFGTVWQPVAAAQGGVKTAHLHFQEIRWHLDLKRHWNGRRIYDPTHNSYRAYSEAATALLFYATPLKQTCVTGRDRKETLTLTDAEFAETAATKTFDESRLSNDELIASLSQYLGMLRGRAAAELAKRVKATGGNEEGAAIIRALIALAGDKTASPTGRGGACRALIDIKHKSKEPLLSLMNAEITKTGIAMIKEPDSYIRYGGGRILLNMPPEAVRPYSDDLMDAILAIDRPTFPLDEENPCRWDHGVMGQVFVNKVLKQGVDDLDRQKLVPVLRSLLATPMSVARTAAAKGIHNLTTEDTLAIADNIIECMKSGSPVNAAGDGTAPMCQNLLAKHHFEEGLYLSLRYDPASAIKSKIPAAYGRGALQAQSIRDTVNLVGDFMLIDALGGMDQVMPQLLTGDGPDTLNRLKAIHSVKAAETAVTLPAAKTELVADATNYGRRDQNDTTYTWRKVYGAGEVSFTPNGSSRSKTTTVTFTGKKPGRYRFEVTMSDTLGLTVLRKTVDVTLKGSNGKLPANRPPQAKSQTLKAVPGLPLPITLSGTDPDGDELGFMVTKQPAHGRIRGDGANITYIAEFGYNGTDKLTFEAIDGQGRAATGTVTFKISDKDVGVAIYEGFDYPEGPVIGNTGGTSFGFAGPWKKSDGKPGPTSFLVDRKPIDKTCKSGSLNYASLPASGGKLVKGERHRDCLRPLDPTTLHGNKLLDNGRELWFSICISPPRSHSDTVSFALDGQDAKLGFSFHGHKSKINATYDGKEAVTNRSPYTRNGHLRGFRDKTKPCMIVGHCTWGKTDTDLDRMEIYCVFDAPEFGPMLVKRPVVVLEQAIPQKSIDAITIHSEQTVDEIRIGTTLHSVMVGTKPLAVE